MDDDEEEHQYRLAFGANANISQQCRNKVNAIRNNDAATVFILVYMDADNLSELAWELLGQYFSNNTHVREVTDAKMALLFSRLRQSASLEIINLGNNFISTEGVRSMLPFLENTPKLRELYLDKNANVNTECFDMLMSALNGSSSMEELWFAHCNIEDISALNTYTLPNLYRIDLSHNTIGREGCITIANLLQSEGSTLTKLYLDSTGMGDDEAEILATALTHNTKLQYLDLELNNIGERGLGAFLKLLNDIASIECTYNSNHTLTTLNLNLSDEVDDNSLLNEIKIACRQNRQSTNPAAVGRAKFIRSQLNSQTRKRYCEWQGIDENSCGNIFADIEPVALLPNILALISGNHGQSELYTTLVPLAPDLLSFIDRKALLKDTMAQNAADIAELAAEHARQVAAFNSKLAALNAKGNKFERRLACMEVEDSSSQSKVMDVNKRRRKC